MPYAIMATAELECCFFETSILFLMLSHCETAPPFFAYKTDMRGTRATMLILGFTRLMSRCRDAAAMRWHRNLVRASRFNQLK